MGSPIRKWVQDAAQLEGFYRFLDGLKLENMAEMLADIRQIGPAGISSEPITQEKIRLS